MHHICINIPDFKRNRDSKINLVGTLVQTNEIPHGHDVLVAVALNLGLKLKQMNFDKKHFSQKLITSNSFNLKDRTHGTTRSATAKIDDRRVGAAVQGVVRRPLLFSFLSTSKRCCCCCLLLLLLCCVTVMHCFIFFFFVVFTFEVLKDLVGPGKRMCGGGEQTRENK